MATAIRRVYDNVRSGQTIFRDANRFRQIVTILARHGFGAFVERISDDKGLLGKIAELRVVQVESLPWERRVLTAIQELGTTFIKLGQILSTRPDVVPPALVSELESLQNEVPPLTIEDVRSVIEAELQGALGEHFEEFDEQPLASASIAQVHRARIKGSREEVVVKVQRPGIRRKIEADIEIMGYLARALEANVPESRTFSPTGIMAEFERAILSELEFLRELDSIKRFRSNFANNPTIYFPKPYPAQSTGRLLCMEFVRGTKITEISHQEFDVEKVVQNGVDAVVQMIFVDGFFHGDLHPGNLLVQEDNSLCFLDFGLCGRLHRKQRDLLVDLLMAVVMEDFEAVARVFWKIGLRSGDSSSDYGAFEADTIDVMERWFAGKTMEELEFSGFIKDIVDGAMRHRVRIPPDYTMTFKALITMEGVAKQLAPGTDMISAARPYVMDMVTERYSPKNLLKSSLEAVRELKDTLGPVPETLRSIFEDLQRGDTKLQVDLRQLSELEATISKAQGRRGVALLAATSALCGTLALDHGGPAILGISSLSFWFYILSIGLTAWFLISGIEPRER